MQRPRWAGDDARGGDRSVGVWCVGGRACVGARSDRIVSGKVQKKKRTSMGYAYIQGRRQSVTVAAADSVCRGEWTSPRWLRSPGCALPLGDDSRPVLSVLEQRRSLTTKLHQRLRPSMQQHKAAKHREGPPQDATQRQGLLQLRVCRIYTHDAIVLDVDKEHTHRSRTVQCTNLHAPTDAPVAGNGALTRGEQQGCRPVSVSRIGRRATATVLATRRPRRTYRVLARQSGARGKNATCRLKASRYAALAAASGATATPPLRSLPLPPPLPVEGARGHDLPLGRRLLPPRPLPPLSLVPLPLLPAPAGGAATSSVVAAAPQSGFPYASRSALSRSSLSPSPSPPSASAPPLHWRP